MGFRNIEIRNSPFWKLILWKSTYPPYSQSFSWTYEFTLRKWRHFRIPIWREGTVSVISSYSEELVANFNIANLNQNVEDYFPNKKARPDLNFWAINLKFAQIVKIYKAYQLYNFQIDSIKIKAHGQSKVHKHKKIQLTQRGCCKFRYCGNPHLPPLSKLSGWNHIIVHSPCLFFVNCELTL